MPDPVEKFHPRMKREVRLEELGEPYPYSAELMHTIIGARSGHIESVTNYSDAITLLKEHLDCSFDDLAARVGATYGQIWRGATARTVPRPQVLKNLARLAASRGLDNYESVLLVEASREEERAMERSRNASPRAD